MTKCQTLREFWHLRLFRWDLLCNLTLDQSKKPPCKRNKWRKKLDNKNYRAQNRRLRGPSLQRTRARKMKEERLRSDQGPVRRELTRWVCVCFLFLCLFVGLYVCCLLFVCTYVCWDPTRGQTRQAASFWTQQSSWNPQNTRTWMVEFSDFAWSVFYLLSFLLIMDPMQ